MVDSLVDTAGAPGEVRRQAISDPTYRWEVGTDPRGQVLVPDPRTAARSCADIVRPTPSGQRCMT